MIHIVKGFDIVNKAVIDIFLELSCFFNDPEDVGNLISGSSAFSKTSLNIWKFTVHVLLKPGLENFEHYFTSVWDECNRAVVWAFLGIAFLWDWNENWNFSSPVATAEFSKFAGILSAALYPVTNYPKSYCSLSIYHMCLQFHLVQEVLGNFSKFQISKWRHGKIHSAKSHSLNGWARMWIWVSFQAQDLEKGRSNAAPP